MEPKAFAQYSGARIWTVQVACSAEQGMDQIGHLIPVSNRILYTFRNKKDTLRLFSSLVKNGEE